MKVANTEIFKRKFLEFENLVIHKENKDDELFKKIKELRDKHREPYY